jgi:2-dehydropantoate 2-reductase
MSGWIPILGRKAVMGGTAWVTGSIIAPGVVRQTGTYQRLIFGELDGSMSRRGQALSDACAAAGAWSSATRLATKRVRPQVA